MMRMEPNNALSPQINKYTKAVSRRLRMPAKIRSRVMSDFVTSILARKEQGVSDDSILQSLGSPAKAAAELNEQMKEFTYRKSPWRFACLAVSILCALWLLLQLLMVKLLSNVFSNPSVGIIGGADGPTAIFVSTAIDSGFPTETVLCLLLLLAGLVGFYCLGRCKKKS